MKLDQWQEEVLETKGDLLLCTGRRVGKTYIMARKAIDKMVKNPKTPIIVMSLTEDQAFIIIIMAKNYLKEAYPKIADKTKSTMRQINLPNESQMIARPAGDTGDGCRGFAGGVLLVDEASRQGRLFWIAAKPILLTTNGEIWMCSTPFGKQGYFWDRFNEAYNLKKPDARFTVFYKSSKEVMEERPISESWTQEQRDGALRLLKEEQEEMSELEFGQEYLGLFLDELRQFFSDELIKSCMTIPTGFQPEPGFSSGDKFLGVDVARQGRDETVLISVNRTQERLRMNDMEITKNQKTTETARLIIHKDNQHDYRKIYIDSTGLGWGVFDIVHEEEQTKRKVVAIENVKTNLDKEKGKEQDQLKRTMKEDLYNNLHNLMEKGMIELFDDPKLTQSLRSIQAENESGKKLKIFGNYSHITEALIRAAWCIKDKTLNIYYYS